MASVHLSNVGKDDSGERLGVHVELEDGEDLGKELLLMEIVELEGCVHSVDNGVLVDESWELSHDGSNQASRVREVVHNVGARDNMVVLVQTVVESGDTVDVMNLMEVVGHSAFTTGSSTTLASVEESHLSVESFESFLSETVGSGLLVLSESSRNKSSMYLDSTFFEKHWSTSSKLRW